MINFNKGSKQGFRSFGLNGVSFVSEISNEQQVRLMFILGKVLSTLPLEAIVASLNRVVGPCVEDLRSLCAAPEADATTKGQLMTRLKMIATLCTTLDVRATGGSVCWVCSLTEAARSRTTTRLIRVNRATVRPLVSSRCCSSLSSCCPT